MTCTKKTCTKNMQKVTSQSTHTKHVQNEGPKYTPKTRKYMLPFRLWAIDHHFGGKHKPRGKRGSKKVPNLTPQTGQKWTRLPGDETEKTINHRCHWNKLTWFLYMLCVFCIVLVRVPIALVGNPCVVLHEVWCVATCCGW